MRFTAVLARNDVTAAGVILALRVAVAVINNSLLARSIDPPLTSVDTFPQVVGRMAVRLIQDRLDWITTSPSLHVSVGSSLIVRQSTLGDPANLARWRKCIAPPAIRASLGATPGHADRGPSMDCLLGGSGRSGSRPMRAPRLRSASSRCRSF